MAVKVMVAPVVVRADEPKSPVARKAAAPREAARPKRRRSSIYDADGNEVFISLICLKCHQMRPLSQFGLRKMADGAIRNQPWCRPCRSAAGTGKGKAREAAAEVESTVSADPLAQVPAPAAPAAEPGAPAARQPRLADQVAAALAAGLGR